MSFVVTNHGRPRPSRKPQGDSDGPGTPGADPAFDQWLTHHLGQLYDPVVHEPLPPELIQLLEKRLK